MKTMSRGLILRAIIPFVAMTYENFGKERGIPGK
jgi:hypothetical protein